MKNKTIWHFPDHNLRVNMCYDKESMKHPAKMQLQLCREIIKAYSKPGDLILDPMVGVGTTIVEGMLLNRNVIGIEYEQKFADMTQKNIDKVNSLWGFTKHGQGQVIKGDSRELTKLLQNVDSVIFSPPFCNTLAGSSKDKLMIHGAAGKDYGTDKENLGNMKYGNVDVVITKYLNVPKYLNILCQLEFIQGQEPIEKHNQKELGEKEHKDD